jgi:hypothetical protein
MDDAPNRDPQRNRDEQPVPDAANCSEIVDLFAHHSAAWGSAASLGCDWTGVCGDTEASRARSLAVAPEILRFFAPVSISAHLSAGIDLRLFQTRASPMDTSASWAKASTEGQRSMMSDRDAIDAELHNAIGIAIRDLLATAEKHYKTQYG